MVHPFFARARATGRPLILGHRGAMAHATENTMTAFALAREHGADGIEFDVQLSADGHVVIFHDAFLARLAGRGEMPTALDLATLQAVRIGRDERIPTLAQVLDEFADSEMVLNIEVKPPGLGRGGPLVDQVLAQVARYRTQESGRRSDSLLERVLISSFDPFVIGRVRRRAPEFATAYLFHEEEPAILIKAWRAPAFRPHALHPEYPMLTAPRLGRWRKWAFELATWTIDDDAHLRRAAAMDVYAVISNDPRHARQVLLD